jgi:hypothetical protein
VIGHEIDAENGEALVRFVRALGQHRYVASRLHLVHAFAIEAACAAADEQDPALGEARAWAASVLGDPEIDRGSKDERLHRRVTDAELVAVLAAFWGPSGEKRARASVALAMRLAEIGCEPPDASLLPFDESDEEDLFPVLVDAGWELLPLGALEPERHKGAIGAFEDIDFDVAKFDEENAVPPIVTLHELPALGAIELLAALDEDGDVRAPFVLWTSGNETYVDYVLRGVLRAAKIGQ